MDLHHGIGFKLTLHKIEWITGGDTTKKMMGIAVCAGVIITGITGIINTTPQGLMGATWYGFPLAWRIIMVTATPVTHYRILHFLGDLVFWGIIAMLILWLYKKAR